MQRWQKYWLYFLIFYAVLHLLRDILQDTGIKIFLSTILIKKSPNPVAIILGTIFNTYIIAAIEIILSVICLKRNFFGTLGFLTIGIALATLFGWLHYWFLSKNTPCFPHFLR